MAIIHKDTDNALYIKVEPINYTWRKSTNDHSVNINECSYINISCSVDIPIKHTLFTEMHIMCVICEGF